MSSTYITTIDGPTSLRPGFLRTHVLKRFHGTCPKGRYVCSVLQTNGFHTVLVINPTASIVSSSAFGNLSLEKAIGAGEHFVKHETVGIPVAWYLGGDKVSESSISDLTRLANSHFIDEYNGKNIFKHNEGYFFIEGNHYRFNTAWSCVSWIDEERLG